MSNSFSVYHVFNARQAHLVPGFISQFQEIGQQYGIPTYFVLCNYSQDRYGQYKKLIEQIGADRFELIEDKWGVFIRKFNRLTGNRRNKFIVHGICIKLWMSLSTVFAARAGMFSWVCWGSGIEDKGLLQNVLKTRLYNSFNKINCLMSCDRNDLGKRFKVTDRAHLIPYVSNYNLQELSHITPYFPQDKLNILIGHRASPYLNHLAIMQQISRYADKDIRVICFLNYGSDDQRYIQQVKDTGKALFGEKFVPVTTMLTKDEYEGVMKSVNITLIAGKTQAGLGAIYRTLLYKGTIFLDAAGKNLEWLNYMKVRAARIDDLPAYSFEDFVNVVNEQQKNENQRTFLAFVDKKRLSDKWRDFIVAD